MEIRPRNTSGRAGHGATNLGRSLALGLGDALPFAGDAGEKAGERGPEAFVATHERRLRRLSANFAFAADLALLLGGRLKFEEMFMGRLADAVGAVFLGYATLHHYARNHANVDAGLQDVAEHALLRLEAGYFVQLEDSLLPFLCRHAARS